MVDGGGDDDDSIGVPSRRLAECYSRPCLKIIERIVLCADLVDIDVAFAVQVVRFSSKLPGGFMSEEQVFLNQDGVYVSNSRVVVGGTTYSTANITSVSTTQTPASSGCAFAVIGLGCLGFISGLLFVSSGESAAILALVFWVLMIAAGIFWLRKLRPTYHVILASASGESKALDSKDEAFVTQFADAVNEALVHRG